MSRFNDRTPNWKGRDMSDKFSRGIAALLDVSTFEASDRISPAQVEKVLRLIIEHTNSFDLVVALSKAADAANTLAGGTVVAERLRKAQIAYAAELYRGRREAVEAYLAEHPEPGFAPLPGPDGWPQ